MYVVATFEQTIYLEMALSEMEMNGIRKEQILAVPLSKRKADRLTTDTMHQADGHSVLDLAAVLGTIFMLLGAIYGFMLRWGPILWGIIGAVAGMSAGFLIKYIVLKRRVKSGFRKKLTSEVVVLVACGEKECDTVETVLWNNKALGVSRLSLENENGQEPRI